MGAPPDNLLSPSPVPDVDFAGNRVVAIFAGERPSGGYSVEFLGMGAVLMRHKNHRGQMLCSRVDAFRYCIVEPGPDVGTTSALTQPYLIRIVPRSRSRLRIVREE